MRHKVRKYKKFNNKDRNHRDAMVRNLVGSFFIHKKIVTTRKKAWAMIWDIDRLIWVAKEGRNMNAIRTASAFLYTREASEALFDIAPKYKDANGGYTRIIPTKERAWDNALLVTIELV